MNIYMIGIGGIGMSALAQLYIARGDRVSGSERAQAPTTELLEKRGVHITYGQLVAQVPPDTDLVVYSDAVAESHIERAQAREMRKEQQSYFQALGTVSRDMRTIAVAGTHGKTTTTAMLGKILIDARKRPTVIVGSLVKDLGSNFVEGDPGLFVVEACEYRDHLLELSPHILVVTNIEWDHTDWFKTEAAMFSTFKRAIDAVPADGVIVCNMAVSYMLPLLKDARARVVSYADEPVPELKLIGEFNKSNARAAAAAAKAACPDLTVQQIATSLATFQGTWRRFEYKGTGPAGADVYDDYAHHPTAIRETVRAARQKFPGKQIVVAFHPHLYSRTRDLFKEFVSALSEADKVFLAPIYAAREEDYGEVSSTLLAQAIAEKNPNVASLPDLDALYDALRTLDHGAVLITMGAGDIYKVADKLVA